jgi:DNA primase
MKCPLCSSRRENMSFTDYGFYCWSCGRKGSVIQFVMDLFDEEYKQALYRLNNDFNLGLDLDRKPTAEERRRAELSQSFYETYRNCKQLLEDTLSDIYNSVENDYFFYDNLYNSLIDDIDNNEEILFNIGIKRYNAKLLIDEIRQVQYEVRKT